MQEKKKVIIDLDAIRRIVYYAHETFKKPLPVVISDPKELQAFLFLSGLSEYLAENNIEAEFKLDILTKWRTD